MLFASTLAPAGAHVSVAQVPGRLPKTVIPVRYDISVAPNLQTMKIAGHERVTIRVLKPTKTIVLNALQTTISQATLDGVAARSVKFAPEIVTLTFPKAASVGVHRLAIDYTATVQTSAQGLFVQKYTDTKGKPAEMIGTQFESTDARRMFPSFDEPAFRAAFHLTATVPAAWTAVSNMPVERSVALGASKRVTFRTTPSMPTYLLVLCAGNFDALHGSANGTPISVYGPKGHGPEYTYALQSLERLVPYFEHYYGIKFPLPKLDLIAIPQFFGGAMENWGGMTFTEDTVAYDPRVESPGVKRSIFDIIAHETSHQWNGDLVTMAWWDSLWLNEGFATWMEAKSTAELNPHWNWWLRFDNATNGSLVADATRTTTKIEVPVHNETEANTVFDPEIAYQKAGAVLRMFEAYLGPQTFRAGLHRYFTANEYDNAVPNDLWNALSAASHRNVKAIAESWIDKPGFPLVSVDATCSNGHRTLHLTQHRYGAAAAGDTTVWEIPLRIESGSGTKSVLFKTRSAAVPGGACSEPLIVNGQDLGYYRVAYDAATRFLQQRFFQRLSVADRLSLLNDSWQFAVDGKAPLSEYLAYVNADSGDRNPTIASTILGHLGEMDAYEYGKPGEQAFKTYSISYLKPLLNALGGWNGPSSNPEITSLRMQVIGALANAGDQATIAEARRRFAVFLTNPESLKPPLQSTVVGIVGRYADAQTYQTLMKAGMSSHDPLKMQEFFFSAFSAKNKALGERSLQMALHLPAQFSSFAPVIAAIVGQDHPALAWAFMQKHEAKLFGGLSEFDRLPYLTGIAQSFWRGVPASQIARFLNANVPAAGRAQVAKAMEGVRTSLANRARLVPQIDAFVKAQ